MKHIYKVKIIFPEYVERVPKRLSSFEVNVSCKYVPELKYALILAIPDDLTTDEEIQLYVQTQTERIARSSKEILEQNPNRDYYIEVEYLPFFSVANMDFDEDEQIIPASYGG